MLLSCCMLWHCWRLVHDDFFSIDKHISEGQPLLIPYEPETKSPWCGSHLCALLLYEPGFFCCECNTMRMDAICYCYDVSYSPASYLFLHDGLKCAGYFSLLDAVMRGA